MGSLLFDTDGNSTYHSRYESMVRRYQANGYLPGDARTMAVGALEETLSTQAAILSYAEGFMLIGLICFPVMPLIFLAKARLSWAQRTKLTQGSRWGKRVPQPMERYSIQFCRSIRCRISHPDAALFD